MDIDRDLSEYVSKSVGMSKSVGKGLMYIEYVY